MPIEADNITSFNETLYLNKIIEVFSGGARKNIEGGPTKYTLIYKHKFFNCNER